MNFQEHKYEIAAVFEAMNNVCSCRQKEDEPLMVYERRMKTHLDLFVSYMGGKLVLDKFKKEASSKDEDFKKKSDDKKDEDVWQRFCKNELPV